MSYTKNQVVAALERAADQCEDQTRYEILIWLAARLGSAHVGVLRDESPGNLVFAPPAATENRCPGIQHAGCNYLAACGTVCNKCGQVVTPLSQPAAPEGYVLVPVEPTEAMIEAWCGLALSRIKRRVFGDDKAPGIVEGCKEGYRAMLAARPKGEGK